LYSDAEKFRIRMAVQDWNDSHEYRHRKYIGRFMYPNYMSLDNEYQVPDRNLTEKFTRQSNQGRDKKAYTKGGNPRRKYLSLEEQSILPFKVTKKMAGEIQDTGRYTLPWQTYRTHAHPQGKKYYWRRDTVLNKVPHSWGLNQ